MKTIMDAVKYYGGDKFICGKHELHHTHIVSAIGTDRFYSACASDVGDHSAICTIIEYNQYIKECETNFGLSVNYDTYKDVFHKSSMSFINCTASDRTSSQPVFTQAMADNGELPPIGSKAICEYCDGEELLIVAHDLLAEDGAFALVCGDSGYWGAEARRWKPIDTRTDKEKAIDDLYESGWFNKPGGANFIDDVKLGKIHGVKWVGK
ncbi:MAG: hypothetical protein CMJ25_13560 [Phycisphaerae bacterium]|nr:hypothetical protein [Phycisphaerae bacterium]|tara:strand:- start:37 stop:663 length:627 start_codon:yes stop_codon:yes gene_type:complete